MSTDPKKLAEEFEHDVWMADPEGIDSAPDKLWLCGFRAALECAEVEAMREALECNRSFHRLGGIDDCEPCKARRNFSALKKRAEG